MISRTMVHSRAPLLLFCYWLLLGAADIEPDTNRGMIIDAGSGGSRLHLFEWKSRVFSTLPPPTSFPSSHTDWTARMGPGLSTYADDPSKVGEHLQPLIDFAMEKLKGREHDFHTYPIYLKATGGMRQLPFKDREKIMDAVRQYMNDKSKVPFYFEQDFARIISGEEEAVYGWTAVNFLMGTLVPQLIGTGTVDANETYGALALGGASAQVAFFLPSQDISANMFKLQIGAQKHWNLYGHSFLWYGLTSARGRFHDQLAQDALADSSMAKRDDDDDEITIVNYCFPNGYDETVKAKSGKVKLVAPRFESDKEARGKLELCRKQSLSLLRLEANDWCKFAHGKGQCSYNGVYQPPLPEGHFGHFVAVTGYHYAWDFFGVPSRAAISEFADRAQAMCTYNMDELTDYLKSEQNKLGNTKQAKEMLPYYCFMASFVLNQLIDGYGFSLDREITVLDTYNGHKVSWALGAMLYEINALPWSCAPTQASALETSVAWGIPVLIGLVLGAALVAVFNRHQRNGYVPVRSHADGDVALTGVSVQRDGENYQEHAASYGTV